MRRTLTPVAGFTELLIRPSSAPQPRPLQPMLDVVRQRTSTMPCPQHQPQPAHNADDGRIRASAGPRNKPLMDFLDCRGIRGLVHFTPMQNLGSILQFGLVPRTTLEAMQLAQQTSFLFTDRIRHDGKDATCLSVCFPNADMFYCKQRDNADWKWVVIVLEVEEIVCHPETTFSVDNAARGGVKVFSGPQGLHSLYGNSPNHWKCPPNRQAEVRVRRVIDPNLIKAICCKTAADVRTAQGIAEMARKRSGSSQLWKVPLAKQYFTNPRPPSHRDMPFS